jgi:hypothetical protein
MTMFNSPLLGLLERVEMGSELWIMFPKAQSSTYWGFLLHFDSITEVKL